MLNDVLKLEELTWKKLDSLDRKKTMFFLVVSPIEEHGPHLPLGVDFFNGQKQAETIAKGFKQIETDWAVVLCPGLPLGTQCIDLVGTVNIRPEVLKDVVVDYLSSIAKYGFKYFVIISGHLAPRHSSVLKEVCGVVSEKYGAKVWSPIAGMLHKMRGLEPGGIPLKAISTNPKGALRTETDFHAGMGETSLMLAQKPCLVDKCYKNLPPALLEGPPRLTTEVVLKVSRGLGYVGVPAKASAAFGRRVSNPLIEAVVQMLVDEVEKA